MVTKLKYTIIASLVLLSCEEQPAVTIPPVPTPNPGAIKVIHDEFEGKAFVVVGSEAGNFMMSYQSVLEGDTLSFEPLNGTLPVIMVDQEGTKWNIFGEGVEGPRNGSQLAPMQSTMSYWFALPAFFEHIEIHDDAGLISNPLPEGNADWNIPVNYIFQGAGKDGILALLNPDFLLFRTGDENGFYLNDQDLVIGIKMDGEVKAYPHKILDWHEIVNDVVGSKEIALNYCPLTGTGFAWNRVLNNQSTTFGVSGLLYNSNLMPYDRLTDSNWSQMKNQCVNGTLKNTVAQTYTIVETTWGTWRSMFDRPLVLSEETGSSWDYQQFPYGTYRDDNNIFYPMTYQDTRLPVKERVHAVIVDDKVKVYRFQSLQ